MMDMIREDLAKLGIHHDLFSSEAELQAEGKPAAAEKWLRDHDLVYDGLLEAPKGETTEDREPVELQLFRTTRLDPKRVRWGKSVSVRRIQGGGRGLEKI